jgi:nitroreductase
MQKTVAAACLVVLASCAVVTLCKSSKVRKQSTSTRTPDHAIEDFFTTRRSLYAMSGEPISDEELMQLFEAARWAPSSFNGQPWRFIYAKRETEQWNVLFDLLVDFNKKWTRKAGALVLVISRNNFEHNEQPNVTHSFDAGAAWENLALQAHLKGLIAHGMGGFDYDRARTVLNIPNEYTIEMMFAVGKPGSLDDLPDDMQTIEDKVSGRKAVEEIAFQVPGPFKK